MDIPQAFDALGISRDVWHVNVSDLQAHETAMKELAHKRYRVLSKVHHPDKDGLGENFKIIKAANDIIQECRFVAPQPINYVGIRVSYGSYWTDTTTS